jgi:hypothetical protein
MRQVARAGRWVWVLCGLATGAALAVPGTRLIVSAGTETPTRAAPPAHVVRGQLQTRTVTVPQLVTSLNVQDYAGPIRVTAAPVSHVEVTETIAYYGSPPAVVQSVSGGRLSLADPACANWTCLVSFTVRVPLGVTVTASGGPMIISGTAGANLDSRGAPVTATNIRGPLTVSTHGGPLDINGLTGPLSADTDGGPATAIRVAAATALVSTGGGPAQVSFSAAPQSVTVSTRGGPATLIVPGGPYALNANSDGALQIIDIATSSTAHRSITITTGGGRLAISSRQSPGTLLPPPMSWREAAGPHTHVPSTASTRRPQALPIVGLSGPQIGYTKLQRR